MNPLHPRSVRRTAGFSLVELMVGVAIGMIAIIVIMQVVLSSDASKRTATSADDAQTTGAIAITTLQHDIRQAGQDLSSGIVQSGTTAWILGCSITLPGGRTLANFGPVTINHPSIPAGDANTDTLLLAYGSDLGSPEGDRVNAQPAGNSYSMATPTAFKLNDLVIAIPLPAPSNAAPCGTTYTMSPITSKTSPVITVSTGTNNMNGGMLFNVGQSSSLKVLAYAVRGGNLTVCDYVANDCGNAANAASSAIWVPIASNVVSMRAQYGVDTSAAPLSGVVATYNQTTPTTACGWVRVPSVRVALVARAAQYDKDFDLSSQAAALASVNTWAGSAGAPIVLSGLADWTHYRYKKYETTVPVRNIAWQAMQQPVQNSGC